MWLVNDRATDDYEQSHQQEQRSFQSSGFASSDKRYDDRSSDQIAARQFVRPNPIEAHAGDAPYCTIKYGRICGLMSNGRMSAFYQDQTFETDPARTSDNAHNRPFRPEFFFPETGR
ncbi:hypothetical protein [Sphingomonas sp. Leaf28]|uniref:hypothetical protein n=1 Tax=Sphingomonas sp. Leaf28 TaxID=1735695 RepID=UPI00138F0A93|nr:hypothetical protein [Sphingomonas sp. Leaf28]